jgi:hypothetical protein
MQEATAKANSAGLNFNNISLTAFMLPHFRFGEGN